MAEALGKFGDVAGAGILAASPVVVDKVAATAGNVVYSHTVPSGQGQQLLSGQVQLTTDATVADRRVVISMYDEAGVLINDVHAGAVVAASQVAQHFELMQGGARETAFIAGTLQVPIPIDWVALPGYTFRIAIAAGVAGDSYSAALLFKNV